MKWLAKIALALFSLLLFLSIFELGVRAYARLTDQERVITADSVLGWKAIPRARQFRQSEAQPYLIAINSKGLRDKEHSYDKRSGVFRIVAIGDSMVFGAGGVDASDRFTDILERSLKNVEVINMGVPAYGTDQEYLYLKNEGFKYHPDLVMLFVYFNDFTESFTTMNPGIGRPKGYFSVSNHELFYHPPKFSAFYMLQQHSYVLGLAHKALISIPGPYRESYQNAPRVLDRAAGIATLQQLYIRARDLCREHGSEFVLVYLPYPGQNSTDIFQQIMGELAATQGVKTLDLADTILRAGAAKPAYFQNDIHFNQYGHQVVAKALLEYLVSGGYLNSDFSLRSPSSSVFRFRFFEAEEMNTPEGVAGGETWFPRIDESARLALMVSINARPGSSRVPAA